MRSVSYICVFSLLTLASVPQADLLWPLKPIFLQSACAEALPVDGPVEGEDQAPPSDTLPGDTDEVVPADEDPYCGQLPDDERAICEATREECVVEKRELDSCMTENGYGNATDPLPTETLTPEPSPSPSPAASPQATATVTPEPTNTATPRPSSTATPTATATPDQTQTATPTPTPTPPTTYCEYICKGEEAHQACLDDCNNSVGTPTPTPSGGGSPCNQNPDDEGFKKARQFMEEETSAKWLKFDFWERVLAATGLNPCETEPEGTPTPTGIDAGIQALASGSDELRRSSEQERGDYAETKAAYTDNEATNADEAQEGMDLGYASASSRAAVTDSDAAIEEGLDQTEIEEQYGVDNQEYSEQMLADQANLVCKAITGLTCMELAQEQGYDYSEICQQGVCVIKNTPEAEDTCVTEIEKDFAEDPDAGCYGEYEAEFCRQMPEYCEPFILYGVAQEQEVVAPAL